MKFSFILNVQNYLQTQDTVEFSNGITISKIITELKKDKNYLDIYRRGFSIGFQND